MDVSQVGTVLEVADGVAKIYGLSSAMAGEMIEFDDGHKTKGLCFNLEENLVSAIVLGDFLQIKEGTTAKTLGNVLRVPVGPEVVGRVVNAIGEPLDGKGPINAKMFRPVESAAPGIADRQRLRFRCKRVSKQSTR